MFFSLLHAQFCVVLCCLVLRRRGVMRIVQVQYSNVLCYTGLLWCSVMQCCDFLSSVVKGCSVLCRYGAVLRMVVFQ